MNYELGSKNDKEEGMYNNYVIIIISINFALYSLGEISLQVQQHDMATTEVLGYMVHII